MSRNRLFVIIGVIGTIGIAVVGVWLWQGRAREVSQPNIASQPEVLSQAGLSFMNAVGQKAPDFTLADIGGNNVTLGNLSGRNVVLFFTEGFMCNPCFNQLVALSKDERLNNNETVSYSIVIGDWEKWHKILADLPPLPPLKVLFDHEGRISRLYDTLNLTSSMHKGLDNGHSYFVIDRKGMVGFAFDDPAMGLRNDQLVGEIEKLNAR